MANVSPSPDKPAAYPGLHQAGKTADERQNRSSGIAEGAAAAVHSAVMPRGAQADPREPDAEA